MIPPGRIVLATINNVSVYYNNMTDGEKAALEAIGSGIIRNVGQGEAWAIIGRKGAARGSVLEQSNQYSTAIAADVPFRNVKIPFVTIQSSRILDAHITLNGVNIVTINRRSHDLLGLHVVVFDDESGNVTSTHYFNTTTSTNFVNLINSLSSGKFVAISATYAFIDMLTEQAIQAIEGLGSKYIRQIQYRGSWAILGRKGAQCGTVLEASSYNGMAEIVSETLPTALVPENKCRIFV